MDRIGMDGTGSIGGARICRVSKARQTRRGHERCGAEGIGSLGKLWIGTMWQVFLTKEQ